MVSWETDWGTMTWKTSLTNGVHCLCIKWSCQLHYQQLWHMRMGPLTLTGHLYESDLCHQIKLHMKAISAAF